MPNNPNGPTLEAFTRTQDMLQRVDLLVEAIGFLGSNALAKHLNETVDSWREVVEHPDTGKRVLRADLPPEDTAVDGPKPPSTVQTEGSEAANEAEQEVIDASDSEEPEHDPTVQDFRLRG